MLERRSETPGTTWGPESRAWEARRRAELLRWRWAADVDPPDADELVDAWREAGPASRRTAAPYELACVRRARWPSCWPRPVTPPAPEQAEAAPETAAAAGRPAAAAPLARAGRVGAGVRPGRRGRRLTPRESEILALVAEGRTNGEIGRQLFISTKTVSVHVSNILGKLGASGRTEAAAIARREGLLG